MKRKVIGITANIVNNSDVPYFDNSKLLRIFSEYSDSVISAGGIPIIIPVTADKEVLDSYIGMIDGLIITGGYDIDPMRFNEEPHIKLEAISKVRDEYEFYLLEKAEETKKPVLGICRGHQLINVAFGGTLYQDLSLMEGAYVKHRQQSFCETVTHKVDIQKDTRLFDVLGAEAFVNSFHHLAIKDVAKGFKVSAISKDGVIEGIEREEGSLLLGVQWHPECLTNNEGKMLDLFKYFISRC